MTARGSRRASAYKDTSAQKHPPLTRKQYFGTKQGMYYSRSSARLLSPSIQIHNSIKTIRPLKIEPNEEDQEHQPEKPKAGKKEKQKAAKGKKAPIEEVVDKQDEPSRDRDLEILDEDSVISIAPVVEDYEEQPKKKTLGLMSDKLSQFQDLETKVFNRPATKSKRSVHPKLLFAQVDVKSTYAMWKLDRNNMYQSNPMYQSQQKSYYNRDKKMLLKRREGTIMKNFVMQQDLEQTKRKTDKELRKLLF